MVRVSYPGLRDPVAVCRELAPYRVQLIRLQMKCRPFGDQYKALGLAVDGLDDAIGALTGDRRLLHLKE